VSILSRQRCRLLTSSLKSVLFTVIFEQQVQDIQAAVLCSSVKGGPALFLCSWGVDVCPGFEKRERDPKMADYCRSLEGCCSSYLCCWCIDVRTVL
jgi:hypothetical protein